MTAAQERVMVALREQQDRNEGWPVTVRQIQERSGYSSTAPVHRALRQLETLGAVECNPFTRLGYRVAA